MSSFPDIAETNLTGHPGVFGLAYGTIAGILIHSSSPRLYATLSGVQFGATGTSFFCRFTLKASALFSRIDSLAVVRSLLLNRDTVLSPDNPSHRVVASGIAGSFAGIIYSAFGEYHLGIWRDANDELSVL